MQSANNSSTTRRTLKELVDEITPSVRFQSAKPPVVSTREEELRRTSDSSQREATTIASQLLQFGRHVSEHITTNPQANETRSKSEIKVDLLASEVQKLAETLAVLSLAQRNALEQPAPESEPTATNFRNISTIKIPLIEQWKALSMHDAQLKCEAYIKEAYAQRREDLAAALRYIQANKNRYPAMWFKFKLLNLTDRDSLDDTDKLTVDSAIQHYEQNPPPRRNYYNGNNGGNYGGRGRGNYRGRGRGGYRGRGRGQYNNNNYYNQQQQANQQSSGGFNPFNIPQQQPWMRPPQQGSQNNNQNFQ